jgi:tRNA (guanine37-N1)-methyltransferase
MRFDILTLFPEIFSGFLSESLLKQAQDNQQLEVHLHNFRNWTHDRHNTVDDRPFGGGPGMVIMPGPLIDCVEEVQTLTEPPAHILLTSPQGKPLKQIDIERFAQLPRIMIICGRYEGFDERISQILQPEEVSLGDFVLNGGEVAAMAIVEAVCRLLPGALGDQLSAVTDSFSFGDRLLEGPQYTRPREYRGLTVPEILLNGNHQAIDKWRLDEGLKRTIERRPDLITEEIQRKIDEANKPKRKRKARPKTDPDANA